MYKAIKEKDLVNVKNAKTGELVFDEWININDFTLDFEGKDFESGRAIIIKYQNNKENFFMYNLKGEFIVGMAGSDDAFYKYNPILKEIDAIEDVLDESEEELEEYIEEDASLEADTNILNVADDEVGSWDLNFHQEHFSIFADPRWINVVLPAEYKKEKNLAFVSPDNPSLHDNYFAFDYSGHLILSAKVDSVFEGDKIVINELNNEFVKLPC